MTDQFVRPEHPHSKTTARIIKVAKIVHQQLGSGFEEVIYQRALALELTAQGLAFSREVWLIKIDVEIEMKIFIEILTNLCYTDFCLGMKRLRQGSGRLWTASRAVLTR